MVVVKGRGKRLQHLQGRNAGMSILVFGGTGSIGTGVAAQLVADGETVAVAARHAPVDGPLAALKGKYGFHAGDITDPAYVRETVEAVKPDAIIHLAAMLIGDCEKEPIRAHAVNVGATMSILEAAAAAGVQRFVFASTIAVYGGGDGPFEESMNPGARSVYGVSKYFCEIAGNRFAKQHGITFVALRYSGVIGPAEVRGEGMAAARDRIKRTVDGKDAEIDFFSGEERTQYTYIDDAVGATLAALRHPKPSYPVYNLAGPDENCISYREYHELIKKLVPSAGNVTFTGRAMRGGGRMVTKRLQDDLGFTPRFTVEQALRDEFKQRGILA
jgi:UDP-glucose 4-epimerase